MSDTVLHLSGTAWKKPIGYDSWLDYLYARTGSTSNRCATIGCDGSADVGAHVKCLYVDDARHWIILACYACNAQRGRVMEIRETAPRVLANLREEHREDRDEEPESDPVGTVVGVVAGVAGATLLTWLAIELFGSRPAPPPPPPPAPPIG